MPKVTIWIRNEDYDKWEAIADKPEWVHRAINTKNMLDNINLDELPKRSESSWRIEGKKIGKLNGVDVITRSDAPPGKIYMIHEDDFNYNPPRNGTLTPVDPTQTIDPTITKDREDVV